MVNFSPEDDNIMNTFMKRIFFQETFYRSNKPFLRNHLRQDVE